MKRTLSILLVFTLLLLCGCDTHTEPTASNPLSDPFLVIRDGVAENPNVISDFRLCAYSGIPCCLTVTRYEKDGVLESVINFDGSIYTISDDNGKRTYPYFLSCTIQYPEMPSVYGEYFLLTEDAGMTAERYLETTLSSATDDSPATEVIYVENTTFDLAKEYGNVPQRFTSLISLHPTSMQMIYGEKCVFSICSVLSLSSSKEGYLLNRYRYDGTPLSQSTIKGYPSRIAELNDDGFAIYSYYYDDGGAYRIGRYDNSGSLLWEHCFEGSRHHITDIIEHGEYIYCFGQVTPEESDSDIYIWCFSADGVLLSQKIIGGTDFDSIYRAEITDNGFTLWGNTQSSDGDLPLSEDGYHVPFRAQLNGEMELIAVQKEEHAYSYSDILGFYQGNAVDYGDPITDRSSLDILPNESSVYVNAVFSWEEGYVIVRSYQMGRWSFSSLAGSYQPQYRQVIYTGYDENGVPIWQTTSDIYIR